MAGDGVARDYRAWHRGAGLTYFRVAVGESDLHIGARRALAGPAQKALTALRTQLTGYIAQHPDFLTSLAPLAVEADAPPLVCAMAAAGRAAGVGPMAAVAGAIAQRVAEALLPESDEVVVENGGDLYLWGRTPRVAALYAGADHPLTGRVGLRLTAEHLPMGVCTSSGTLGPSRSFGRADAAMALSPDGALADAVATALGNRVRTAQDLEGAVAWAAGLPGMTGALALCQGRLAAAGRLELVRLRA